MFDLHNVTISISTLRKSVVTQSRKDNWNRNDQIELSRTMLHTIKTADTVYNRMKSDEKSVVIPARFSSKFDDDVKIRRKSNRWTSDEEDKLKEGVEKLGIGNWKKIYEEYFFKSNRYPGDLKDKWRNLGLISSIIIFLNNDYWIKIIIIFFTIKFIEYQVNKNYFRNEKQ